MLTLTKKGNWGYVYSQKNIVFATEQEAKAYIFDYCKAYEIRYAGLNSNIRKSGPKEWCCSHAEGAGDITDSVVLTYKKVETAKRSRSLEDTGIF